jgi:hypothetical protein
MSQAPDPYVAPMASLDDAAVGPKTWRGILAIVAWFAAFAATWLFVSIAFRIGSDYFYAWAFLGKATNGESLPFGLEFPAMRVVSLFALSPLLLAVAWVVNRLFRARGPVPFLVATGLFFWTFYEIDFFILKPTGEHAVVFTAGLTLLLALVHRWKRIETPTIDRGSRVAPPA